MFLNLTLFIISIVYFKKAQGWNDDYSILIARKNLFKGDVIEISMNGMNFTKDLQMKPPLMVFIVMNDKSLGYEFGSTYPYLTHKEPVWNFNAAQNDKHFFWSPSTVAFEIDFTTQNTSSMTNFTTKNSEAVLNKTDQMIKTTSSKHDGNILYNLNFMLPVDAAESEGLYTFYWHSFGNFPIKMKISAMTDSIPIDIIFRIIWYCFQSISYILIIYIVLMRFKWHDKFFKRITCAYPACKLILSFLDVWCYSVRTTRYKYVSKSDDMNHSYFTYETLLSFLSLFIYLYAYVPLLYLIREVLMARRTGFYFRTIATVPCFIILVSLHVLEWLMMAHFTLENCLENVKRQHGTLDLGFMHSIYFYYHATNFIMLYEALPKNREHQEALLKRKKSRTLELPNEMPKELVKETKKFNSRFWRCRLLITIYVLIQFFQLVLVAMVAFNLPFYTYCIKFIIDDLLSGTLWYFCIFKIARYCNDTFNSHHSYENNSNDAAATATFL